MPKLEKIKYVDIADISVPRERVTSVWDPAIEEEFRESVKAKGILEPVNLLNIDGQLWLVDGLHRLQIAEKMGMSKVPALIKKGGLEDLLIENIIRARQRGKSNPAQEAEVLDLLCTKRGFPLENASKQMGMSLGWAKKLLKIARLPDEIKDRLKHGKIPVTGAFYIADLPSAADQLSVSKDAEFYNYSAAQIKARVWQLLNPDIEPKEGSYAFTEKGKPQAIPLTCHFCGAELPSKGAPYVWTCEGCEKLARETIQYYLKTYVKTPPPPSTETPITSPRDTTETPEST